MGVPPRLERLGPRFSSVPLGSAQIEPREITRLLYAPSHFIDTLRPGSLPAMQNAIVKAANLLGGEPVFRGTRAAFKILIDYAEGGDTLDQFLGQYPSVSHEFAVAAVEPARASHENSRY